jgi:cell division control protein 45
MSIISLTNHFLNDRISQVEYESDVEELKSEVDRLTIIPVIDELNSLDSGKIVSSEDFSIVFQEDLHLMLLRHWNLYESMYHSPYVASKLGIWKEKGIQRLTNLLVTLGYIALTQSSAEGI